MSAGRLVEDSLNDILEAACKAIEFVAEMDSENLADDDKTEYAVIRALEVVGEAARRIPETFREKHPDIPWSEMAGMRDKLIHDYFGVDVETVWMTVTEKIPEINPLIKKLLEQS